MVFDNFLTTMSVIIKGVIGSIQYYYKCQVAGREDRKCRHVSDDEVIIPNPNKDPNNDDKEKEPYIEKELAALKASNRAP